MRVQVTALVRKAPLSIRVRQLWHTSIEKLLAADEERRRKERQAKLEQLRVDLLLGQADALDQADRIRKYVAAVQSRNERAPYPLTPEDLREWTCWALAQADRIDPVLSAAYKTRPAEPEERRGRA